MNQERGKGLILLPAVDLGDGLGGEHMGADHRLIPTLQDEFLQPLGIQGVDAVDGGIAAGGVVIQKTIARSKQFGGVLV